jgi:sulfate transport system substrate-binding protein
MVLKVPRRGFLTLMVSLSMTPMAMAQKDHNLLNVSYEPTRELYQEVNTVFTQHWKERTGERVTINQSHGGSGKQAREDQGEEH